MIAGTPDYRDAGLEFPSGLAFGTTTSAFRVEGAIDEFGRGASVWDVFAHTAGRIRDGSTGARAADHHRRLDSDLDRLAELGVTAHRFSLSWSRVLPTGSGQVSRAGIDFYSRLVDGLLQRGIAPHATLYDGDLPQSVEDTDGWPNRDTPHRFAEFAWVIGSELGDRVHTWTTLDDPFSSAFLAYSAGIRAPGRTNPAKALAAAHHLNLAHGLAVVALRSAARPGAAIAVALDRAIVRPASDDADDAVRRIDGLANRVFTGPMLRGEYPEDVLRDTVGVSDWAFVRSGDLDSIHQPLDRLGVGYRAPIEVRPATRRRVSAAIGRVATVSHSAWPAGDDIEFVAPRPPLTGLGDQIAPEALEAELVALHEAHPDLPLTLAVGGAAFPDDVRDDRVHDPARVDFLIRHATAIHRALARGVDVREVFLGTLLDGFEAERGLSARCGLVHVDHESMTRTLKDSGRWFAELAHSRRIPDRPDRR